MKIIACGRVLSPHNVFVPGMKVRVRGWVCGACVHMRSSVLPPLIAYLPNTTMTCETHCEAYIGNRENVFFFFSDQI